MGRRIELILLLLFIPYFAVSLKNNDDYHALISFEDQLQYMPPIWVGSEPCVNKWVGIECSNSRVISIQLLSMDLSGTLSSEIGLLSELRTLDLSFNKDLTGPLPPSIGNLTKLVTLNLIGCGFFGAIPDTIGNLLRLSTLSLTNNSFSGPIPPSIGYLSKLFWLDLGANQLSGSLPVSPGLDMLFRAGHFHLDNNNLSGKIPDQIFNSKMNLIHFIANNNNFNGNIPGTIGFVQTLEVIRLDGNSLSGPVPSNLSNLVKVNELYLSNNKLTGSIPNLSSMNLLTMDLSNNSFDASNIPPWFSTLQFLATLAMEDTQLQGPVPSSIFNLPYLQSVVLRNNNLNSTLNIGTMYSKQLQLIDLENNSIDGYAAIIGGYSNNLTLVHNPYCDLRDAIARYCAVPQLDISYSIPTDNCKTVCETNQTSSPDCECAYPYNGTLLFRTLSFSPLGNASYYTYLHEYLMQAFQNYSLPVDSVRLVYPTTKKSAMKLELRLELFPSGLDNFNRTGVSAIGFLFSNQSFNAPDGFGVYYFLGDPYPYYDVTEPGKPPGVGVIVGPVAGGTILLLLLIASGIYAFRQKKRAKRASERLNPFANWDTSSGSGTIPQLKGAIAFSFEELKKYTNKFSEANSIGSGGYGKVYRGTLSTGQLIAIKRAQIESTQGGVEFKTEIELLSRVHHKNLVGLVGFCFDQGEQMLVYEYVPNGTLKDSLSGKSGIRLDWGRRLKVSLGAAKGLAYLHELANPPIIHRDIKSSNILLDEQLNAKVADFGLSKSMVDGEKTYVTTQVKGTMGYLDPEYYMTQQLTDKSDVYSFGVLMLELITARIPIQRGKYVVRVVKTTMDKTKELYNLQGVLDPVMGFQSSLKGLEKFVDLAIRCVEESGAARPTMGLVVKEIEKIMEIAGLNPNAESASTSESYEVNRVNLGHPYSNEVFDYSGVYPCSKVGPY